MTSTTFKLNTDAAIPALGLGVSCSPSLLSSSPLLPSSSLIPSSPSPLLVHHLLTPPGTWQGEPDKVRVAVAHAIRHGYRLIDCAFIYGNEEAVGAGIRDVLAEGVVAREDLFVTTKLWTTDADRVAIGLERSLQNLGLDYVDLYLVVRPTDTENILPPSSPR